MSTVQHIGINCRDVKAQEALYTKHFGFRHCCTFRADTPDEFIMLRLGSMCLELFSASADDKELKGGSQPIGFKHLAFEVDDIEATVAGLEADGIKTEGIKDCSHAMEGLRNCFFDDPDGNRIELLQGYRDQF
jgi:glyoxylase I family protein